MKRRGFIKFSLLGFLTSCLPAFGKSKTPLTPTPKDAEGPFYPIERRSDEDNLLVKVEGKPELAQGKILHLKGQLLTRTGQGIEGATIEIWQTDPQGRYHHPGDSEPSERDKNFQYWGKTLTQADGSYSFQTLLPGHYTGRRPHIHFKVWQGNKALLTSQIYFANHPENHKMPAWERMRKREGQLTELLTDAQAPTSGNYTCYFPIVLA